MAYALHCSLPPVATLIFAISAVIAGRVKNPNPLAGKEHLVQLQKNILTNTLEQFTVYFTTSMVLACYLQGPEMRLVALYAMAFTVGRILFNIGYRIGWVHRAAGIGVMAYSLLTVLVITVYTIAGVGFFGTVEVASSSPGGMAGNDEL